tara:strand:+ start:153902 stop:154120 length:219 start_codon:yes stop_codon:yes gene_type:complete
MYFRYYMSVFTAQPAVAKQQKLQTLQITKLDTVTHKRFETIIAKITLYNPFFAKKFSIIVWKIQLTIQIQTI